MPRGVRGSVDYAAQIQKIDEKIERYNRLIAKMKEQRQIFSLKQRDSDLKELRVFLDRNHLTPKEAIEQIVVSQTSTAASTDPQSYQV